MENRNGLIKLGGMLCLTLLVIGCLTQMVSLANVANKLFQLLKPFLYGSLIAYLLCPLCNRLENLFMKGRRRLGLKREAWGCRNTGILLSMLVLILTAGIVIYLIVPKLIVNISTVVSSLPELIQKMELEINSHLEEFPAARVQVDSVAVYLTELAGKMNLESIWGNLMAGMTATFSTLYNLFMGCIFAVYLLANTKKLALQGKRVLKAYLPEKWSGWLLEEIRFADRMLSGFLVGKVLDSCLVGMIAYVLFAIFGFTDALLLAVIVGVTNIIPFFGPFIGLIPCAFFALIQQGGFYCVGCIVLILALQQVDGNFIGPKVLGQKTGLASIWVFFSIVFFGNLWGFAGMLLGVPIFAVIYDVAGKAVAQKEKQRVQKPEK